MKEDNIASCETVGDPMSLYNKPLGIQAGLASREIKNSPAFPDAAGAIVPVGSIKIDRTPWFAAK